MSNRPHSQPSSQRVQKAQAAGSASSSRLFLIIGGATAVVVVLLIVAIVATRSNSTDVTVGGPPATTATGQTAQPIVYGTVTVTGTNLVQGPTAAGAADDAIGKTVPKIDGQLLNGAGALTIPVSGKPKIVMFIAHWCSHCQKEVPIISDYLNTNGLPKDVDLYAVATSTDESANNFPPASWLAEKNWPVRTIADDQAGTAAKAYGVSAFPFFVVVDASGKVVERQSGELGIEKFQALIAAAKSGTASTS